MQPPFVGLSRGGLSQDKFFIVPVAGEPMMRLRRLAACCRKDRVRATIVVEHISIISIFGF
jgi:hypothetical protein